MHRINVKMNGKEIIPIFFICIMNDYYGTYIPTNINNNNNYRIWIWVEVMMII